MTLSDTESEALDSLVVKSEDESKRLANEFEVTINNIINTGVQPESVHSGDESNSSSEMVTEGAGNQNRNAEEQLIPEENDTNTTELVVLHPDHPLMKRFQDALTKMLKEHIAKVSVDLREKTEQLKREKKDHLDLGSTLYNAQQELAGFQGQLQKKHEENVERQSRRQKMDEQLTVLRKQLKKTQIDYDLEYKKMTSMREEVDNLALRLFYLNNAKSEVKSDITIMRRAAEKASTELSKAESEKLHQDVVAHRMQSTVDQLTEDCALLNEQLIAAESDLRAGEGVLQDMENQVMGIKTDRKRLMAHWTTSLIGLQRRNEAYASLMKDFNKKQEEMTIVSAETEGVKRNISQEQEAHEHLTVQLHRTQGEVDMMNKELDKLRSRHDEVREEFVQTQRIMKETDNSLENAYATQAHLNQELKLIRKRMEKELLKKRQLEDQIDLLLRDKLSATKASVYVKKMATNVHDQSRELESQAAMLENLLSNDALEVARIKAETNRLKDQVRELEGEISKRNDVLNKVQQKINQANITVQRKQNQIDILNRKFQRLLKDNGGVELGPLEIMRNHLVKGIAAKQEEIGHLEQQWLKEQTDLVNKVKEKEDLGEELLRQQCSLAVLAKKKLRLDAEMDALEREKLRLSRDLMRLQTSMARLTRALGILAEMNALEREKLRLSRDLMRLQTSMARLNKDIHNQRSSGSALEQENKLAEEDFIRSLREKESQAVELEAKLEDTITEKEEFLAELLETERYIMLWEKKVQLVNETRQAVDSAIGQGEMKAMQIEIHRMEQRKAQILRQQETLIQALEQSVQKRDTIIIRNESKRNLRAKENVTKNAMLRQIDDLRSQISTNDKSIVEYDTESAKLETETRRLEKDLESKYLTCETVRKRSALLTKQLQELAEYRQKMRQHASRYWEQLLAGRYRRLCPTTQSAKSERERQIGRMRSMLAVVDRLTSEFPIIKQDLSAVWNILTYKLEDEQQLDTRESTSGV